MSRLHNVPSQINILSLCSGIGGIELGIKLVMPSSRTVCYVEGEAYSAAILATRMAEGHLDTAPIYSDVRSFYAKPWRGVVDLVTAGFPCQPFSQAGKRQYEDDPRHLWPYIARIVEECEPSYVFLENVNIRAFVEPYRDLRAMGFSLSDPFACTAAELGAGHLRRRIFVLAYRHDRGQQGIWQSQEQPPDAESLSSNAIDGPRNESWRGSRSSGPSPSELGQISSDGNSRRREDVEHSQYEWESTSRSEPIGSTSSTRIEHSRKIGADFWASEPELERLVYGISNRVDRDRALGNAVVPAMAAFAFKELMK